MNTKVPLLLICLWPMSSPADFLLGEPPLAPENVASLRRSFRNQATGGFVIDTQSRERVRAFYNAVYTASSGVAMGATTVTANCVPGTTAAEFRNAVLRRINWFRAMAGIPAEVTLDPGYSAKCQSAALMMSANGALNHYPPSSWTCYTTEGKDAAANSNLALGESGPEAVTGYIWDYGANQPVGHRRWLLYPQTRLMGTGDVPSQGDAMTANAVWVFDGHFNDPRPATRTPYVAWPPAGYVPYPVVFPRWSFGHPGADFRNATVSLHSNDVPVAVALEPLQNGYGENTLVWVPMGLNAFGTATWPFNGLDTTYRVQIGNVTIGNVATNFSYTVTVFDPEQPGPDAQPPVISGPAQPIVGWTNAYAISPVPDASRYDWLHTRRENYSLVDGAESGLGNFITNTSAGYSVLATRPVAAGNYAFQLKHVEPRAQTLTLNQVLSPLPNTVLQFKSRLGVATPSQVARVQGSTTGGRTWFDLYSQPGVGVDGETSYITRSIPLAAFAGANLQVRFNYDYLSPGSYYPQPDAGVGWHLDDIRITDAMRVVGSVTNQATGTVFGFNPPASGTYYLQARAVIFGDFPLDWGPTLAVSATTNAPAIPVLRITSVATEAGAARIMFIVESGAASAFRLQYAPAVGTAWSDDTAAVLTTITPGASYRFTTPMAPASRFYRIASP